MNFLNTACHAILTENGADPKSLSLNYKKQLKELILENIPDIVIVKSARKNEPDCLISSSTEVHALKIHTYSTADETDICFLRKVAKKIRDEVLKQSGNFKASF